MKKKKLLLGVCGSVGASSLINYVSVLCAHFEIRIIFTHSALHFVKPEGFRSLVDDYYESEFEDMLPLHITLSEWADYFVLLPASANTISKMAHGIADNLLTSTLLAYERPVYIAANMNPRMWNNAIFQDQVKYLQEKGHLFINEGKMAIEVATGKRIYSEACMPSFEHLLDVLGAQQKETSQNVSD